MVLEEPFNSTWYKGTPIGLLKSELNYSQHGNNYQIIRHRYFKFQMTFIKHFSLN